MIISTSSELRARNRPTGSALPDLLVLMLASVIIVRMAGGLLERLLSARLNYALSLTADGITFGLFALLASGCFKRRHGATTTSNVVWLVILVFTLGCFNPLVFGTPLSIFGVRAMTLPLVTFVVVRNLPLRAKHVRRLWRLLGLAAIINFLIAIRQSATGLTPGELNMIVANGSTYLVGDAIRLPGLFASGQELALLAGGVGAWALVRFMSMGSAAGVTTIALGIGGTATLLLALQRGPLIALITSLLLVSLAMASRSGKVARRAIVVASALSALLGGAVALIAVFDAQRASSFASAFAALTDLGSDTSFRTRLGQTIPTSLSLLSDHPLAGYGTGASGPPASALPLQSPLRNFPLGGLVADNGFLMVALQVGLLGALFFTLLLALWLKHGGVYGNPRNSWSARALILYLVMAMMFGGYWGLTGPMALLFTLLALGERSALSPRDRSSAPSGSMSTRGGSR